VYASSISYLEPYESSRCEEAKIALVRFHTPLSDPRDSFEELGFVFKIQKKTSRWIQKKTSGLVSVARCDSIPWLVEVGGRW
jgi:hypothetical protein